MDFHYFSMLLGNSGKSLIHTRKLCASIFLIIAKAYLRRSGRIDNPLPPAGHVHHVAVYLVTTWQHASFIRS